MQLWIAGTFVWFSFIGGRYYFFGKWSVYKADKYTDEEKTGQAQLNKRDWGYNAYYKPDLARSRKRIIQEA